MMRIMTGVASTCGSMASLNRLGEMFGQPPRVAWPSFRSQRYLTHPSCSPLALPQIRSPIGMSDKCAVHLSPLRESPRIVRCERVRGTVYRRSLTPQPGLHLSMQSDLSHKGKR